MNSYIKIDFLYMYRINDNQLMVNYRTNLHSHYFIIKDTLYDIYDIFTIIEKIEKNLYYKCFPIIDDDDDF